MAAMRIAYGLAFGSGVGTHLTVFQRGEHHLQGTRYQQILIVAYAIALYAATHLGLALKEAAVEISTLAAVFLAGIYSSLCVYRVFFSPLRKFPGPLGARLSDLYFASYVQKRDVHQNLARFHKRYGNYLQIGSNTLSVTDPRAIAAVFGPGSKCSKADWYDQTLPTVSLHSARDKGFHAKRRRVWSTAFSDKALRDYEERIAKYNDKLVSQIAAHGSEPVNATKWMNFLTFDIMGELGFGEGFDMLKGEEHWAIKQLAIGTGRLGNMLPTWLFMMMLEIPGFATEHWRWFSYVRQRLEERIRNPPEQADIMSYLLAASKDPHNEEEFKLLWGEAELIVVAGSDTTAITLTHIFYRLCQHPEHIAKIRAELEPLVGPDGAYPKNADLMPLEHLNAVINETMRMNPTTPSAFPRLTPPEGLEVGETHIPGDIVIWCPPYVIGRSEEAFAEPETFIPERWTTRPELVRHRDAFAPFLLGVYGCIGRPMAQLNLRTTVARLLLEFDVEFAPGETGWSLEHDAWEHFTLVPGQLHLRFSKRTR